MRGRVDKARYILADLVAMSIAPDAAANLNRYGSTYINNNKTELAQDVLAILEQVKLQLELQLKVDLNKIDTTPSLRVQPTTEEAKNLKALSQHLYQTTARKDFREISGSLKRTLEPIIHDINTAFPSEYYLLKNANSVEPFTLLEIDESKKPTCKKERMNTISDAIGAVQVKMESVCKGSFEQSELKLNR